MIKNREIIIVAICSLLAVATVCVLSVVFAMSAVPAVLLVAALLGIIWLVDMRFRYKHMQEMTEDIDRILHGCEDVRLSDYREGDLSLLKNEIGKMTAMLKHQTEQLKKDKLGLADSLADISHQIRTPLTSLNLMLAALKQEDISEEKRQKTLFDMGRRLDSIDKLVGALLKLAKMDAGTIKLKNEEVRLEELVHKALQPIEIMLELKAIQVKMQVSGSFRGDMQWSTEAVGNILKNCMEHTGEGGEIHITGQENAVYTELVIEDTGRGIAETDLPHIFERFYKGEGDNTDSYGIGLSLARAIIAGENGTIKAENVKDRDGMVQGARFIMRYYKSIV